MFLDRQRPKVAECDVCGVAKSQAAVQRHSNVGGVQPKPTLVLGDIGNAEKFQRTDPRDDPEKDKQDAVIKGKNPKRAAHVELAEISLSPFGVQEDAGDEKPRKDKKQIDADPPGPCEFVRPL